MAARGMNARRKEKRRRHAKSRKAAAAAAPRPARAPRRRAARRPPTADFGGRDEKARPCRSFQLLSFLAAIAAPDERCVYWIGAHPLHLSLASLKAMPSKSPPPR